MTRSFTASSNELNKKVLLRPDQKSDLWMMDLVSEFCKQSELVQHTCTGPLATAKDFLLLREHHRLIDVKMSLIALRISKQRC